MADFDEEALIPFGGGQEYTGGFVRHEGEIDFTGGSRADYERTGAGKAFERKDLYDMSPEGKMMIEVRKVLDTYSDFSTVKYNRLEDAIKRYDTKLKLCNPPLIVQATLFLDIYENSGGLDKKNFSNFEKKHKRRNIRSIDLIRYIRYLDTLGMEVRLER
jgi:hypothetical protein